MDTVNLHYKSVKKIASFYVAKVIIAFKDKERSHQLKGDSLDKTKKSVSIKTLYSSLLNQSKDIKKFMTKSSFLREDREFADVTLVCKECQIC